MGAKETRLFWKQEAKSSILLSPTICSEMSVCVQITAMVATNSSMRPFAIAVIAMTTTNTTTSSYHRVVCVVIWINEPSYIVGNQLLQRVKLRPLSCLVMAPVLQTGLGEFDPHRG